MMFLAAPGRSNTTKSVVKTTSMTTNHINSNNNNTRSTTPVSTTTSSQQTNFVVQAAHAALQPLAVGQTVYLLDPDFCHDWLNWAWHCGGVRDKVLQRLALQWSLPIAAAAHDEFVTTNTWIRGPGPIDSSCLGSAADWMVLNPRVHTRPTTTALFPRVVRSDLTNLVKKNNNNNNNNTSLNHSYHQTSTTPTRRRTSFQLSTSISTSTLSPEEEEKKQQDEDDQPAIAVHQDFYEMLRRVHGVLCSDGRTVSFQKPDRHERFLLYAPPSSSSHHQQQQVRPLEFRRKVILAPASQSQTIPSSPSHSLSLMEKLMLQETSQELVPTVELHPLRLSYRLFRSDDGDDDYDSSTISSHQQHQQYLADDTTSHQQQQHHNGWVLASAASPLLDTLLSVVQVAAPNASSQSLRIWAHCQYDNYHHSDPKNNLPCPGDGYELIDDMLDVSNNNNHSSSNNNNGTNSNKYLLKDLPSTELLLETRRTVNSAWPRKRLVERLAVGDFCDAQDVAGQWYEAVVRDINTEDDTMRVHFLGWHSKWDGVVPRYTKTDGKGPGPPAPLWTRTSRWRQNLKPGDAVEVRDSSSLVDRPKWYAGVVVQVGLPSDHLRPVEGGADLEDPNLWLLHRSQQVLVQVEQEKTDKAGMPSSTASSSSSGEPLAPEPPFRRWVQLYGEEICAFRTHLRDRNAGGPATLQYDLGYGRHKPVEVLKGHGAGFLRESLRGLPPAPGSVGLHNLGNSCFLNSILQCLNHTAPLTQYFLQDLYLQDLNRSNPLGSGGQVAQAYASVLHKMWSGEYSSLAPRMLKQTVANFAPQFDNSYQHDSQEFCQFLLDGLHEDLNRVKDKPYVEELEGFGRPDHETAIESWRKHLLRHDSIIVDHFQGMHRSHLTCPHCGRESIKFDVFSTISLPLVRFKDTCQTIKLEDCLEKFMEGEQLDELNAWYCPRCRQHVCALKMMALWSVPDILVLHLKRFTFDTCLTSGHMLRSKMTSLVEFPVENLDLTRHILGPTDPDAPAVYELFGVSEHTGPTANSGHYTATVRNSVDRGWYRYNDSHVGRSAAEASITGGAYVLFYKRQKGLSKWAGLDRVMREQNIDPYGTEPIVWKDADGFVAVNNKKKNRKG